MKTPSLALAYLGIFSLLVTVQACSSSSSHSSATSTSPGTASSSGALAAGSYTNSNTPEGPQTLTMLAGAKYRQDIPHAGITIEGTATMAGDKATFTETSGGSCTGNPGVYTVVVSSTAVSFTKVQDTCTERVADFTSGPWTSQH